MFATAKLFISGNSQAVRLPKAFRVSATEMWISKNAASGELILKPKPCTAELDSFFNLLSSYPQNTPEFMMPRDDEPRSDPFAE